MTKAKSILLASLALALAPPVAAKPAEEADLISYACSDVVVVGWVENVEGSYKQIDNEDDILGHGLMTANVTLKRVLSGSEARPAVQAEYWGHTYLRLSPGKLYLAILRTDDDGAYTLVSIMRWNREARSTLAKECS